MHNNIPLVLACIDGSKFGAAVCDYAAWISRTVNAPLKLLHNIEQRDTARDTDLSGTIGLGSQEHLLEELIELEQQRGKLELEKGRLMLDAARKRLEQRGVEDLVVQQRHGGLTESLVELEDSIRVLVLGIRGEAHADDPKHLGRHLETVARSLHRPILVVNREFSPPRRIMLAYHASAGARKALDMVARSPLFKSVPCHLVYVGDENATTEAMLEEAAGVLRETGQEVVTARLTGKVGDALCDYQSQHHIDLTLMGAFSHNRFRDLLVGSLTARVLLQTRQPVLLLR